MKENKIVYITIPDWQLDPVKFAERRSIYIALDKEKKEREAERASAEIFFNQFCEQAGSKQRALHLLEKYSKFSHCNSNTLILNSYCSVRLKKILKSNIETLGLDINDKTKLIDLSILWISDFIKCKGSGSVLYGELITLCFYASIDLM